MNASQARASKWWTLWLLPLLIDAGCSNASNGTQADTSTSTSASATSTTSSAASTTVGTSAMTDSSANHSSMGANDASSGRASSSSETEETSTSSSTTTTTTASSISDTTSTAGSSSAPSTDASTTETSDTDVSILPVDVVTMTNSTFAFQHYPIETNADGVWNGPETPGTQPVTTNYDTVILENGFLKVTLLPSFGGRILSLLHKPSNREFLYQNPIGTPYLMQQDIFYYDYLVIMGGIFPSFPEPEHGKYWDQPYDFEVVSESEAAITVRMSRLDDRELASGVPERYDVGRTDVRVALDVTLRAGSASLDLQTTLTNTRSEPVPAFEYWTITTLAPGSTPGDTKIPLNTRILAKMDQVHLYESSWSWFGDAEERVDGEVFEWKNLAEFDNWVDQGTAFASPSYQANWSGLMNADSNMAIVCVSDPAKVLGLKLWTFGKQSLDVDTADSTQWLRPTIEMWHGVTPEFWMRGSLEANEVRSWTEHYFPTLGLSDITSANEYGAVQLTSTKDATETTLALAASLTRPDERVHVMLRLDGATVAEQDVAVSPLEPSSVTVKVPNEMAAPGMVYEAEILRGDVSALSGSIVLP